MEKVPNIVRQRLTAQEPAGHPDADLLAAFAEQRLSGAERENVLAHLSACSACREIVAIASSAAPSFPVTPVMEPATRSRAWWAIPAFQWGAAAAALAMIAVGLLVLQPGQKREQIAKNTEFKLPATESPDRSNQAAPSTQQNRSLLNERAIAPDRRARVLRPGEAPAFTANAKQAPASREAASSTAAVETLSDSGAFAKDLSKAGTMPRREARVKPQAPAAVTLEAESQNVPVADRSAPVQTAGFGAGRGGGIGAGQGAGIGPGNGPAPTKVVNESVTVGAADQASSLGQRAAQTTTPSSSAPTTAQTSPSASNTAAASQESASSTAQDTTQAAALSASHAADELATGRAGSAVEAQRKNRALAVKPAPGTWRITNGRLQHFDGTSGAWNDIDVGTTARLSIVSTLGPEVWVGGTDGAMFYSNDQGAHWIPTSTGGWSKDATITGMTPTARRSVEVYFSNGERWRSGDGGASWSRYQ